MIQKRLPSYPREHWKTKVGFILAAAGSAIGLGNFWRFPYLAGTSGGGAFVLIYLFSVLIIGLPIMIAEFLMGRAAQGSIVTAYKKFAANKKLWSWAGLIGVIASIVILSYYAVVGGWVLAYLVRSLVGALPHQGNEASLAFIRLNSSPLSQWFWYTLFFALTVLIVRGGIIKGIEKWNKILMTIFLFLLVVITLYALQLKGAGEAARFLFKPNFAAFSPSIALLAVGHTLFSLSLGAGTMVTYGSYLSKKMSLTFASVVTSLIDTVVALLAGLTIFSIVFSFNFSPASGPGLAFITLPPLFASMPAGAIIAVVFFLLLAIAGLSSAVSILEVIVTYLKDEWKIAHANSIWLGGLTYFLGLFWTKYDFSLADKIAGGSLLVLGALFVSLFVGWVVKPQVVAAQLNLSERSGLFVTLRLLLRWLIPLLLAVLLLAGTI